MWGSEVPISPPFNDHSLFSNVPLPYLPECFFWKCNFVRIPKLFFSVNSVRYFITAFPVVDPFTVCSVKCEMNVSLASTFSLQTNYWNVDPTFETVNKVLWCDLSNETSSAVLLNGRTFSSEFKVLGNTLNAGRNGYRTVFHSCLGDDSWLPKRQYRLACDIARCRIHRCWEYVSLSETDCLLCLNGFYL